MFISSSAADLGTAVEVLDTEEPFTGNWEDVCQCGVTLESACLGFHAAIYNADCGMLIKIKTKFCLLVCFVVVVVVVITSRKYLP